MMTKNVEYRIARMLATLKNALRKSCGFMRKFSIFAINVVIVLHSISSQASNNRVFKVCLKHNISLIRAFFLLYLTSAIQFRIV